MQFDTAQDIVGEEHWAKKGEVDLFIFRKYSPTARAAHPDLPVLFFVHGSSFSARTSYDLEIPEHGEYSLMNVFATYGYDVWTMDHEGYGRSSRTDGFSFVADGVEDLKGRDTGLGTSYGKNKVRLVWHVIRRAEGGPIHE